VLKKYLMVKTCAILTMSENTYMDIFRRFNSWQISVKAAPLAALAGLLISIGCAPPSYVEGTVNQEEIQILDDAAMYRADQDNKRLLLVISEDKNETLRVASITIPDVSVIDIETDIDIGTESANLPFIRLAQGELVVSYREDGVRILSTRDTEIFESISGTLHFSSLQNAYSGHFQADLENGGQLEGSFHIEAESQN
jgi:hypothetical protein